MAFNKKKKFCNYFLRIMPHAKDIIGIKFVDKEMGQGAFITWGRVCSKSDLLKIIKAQCAKQNLKDIQSIEYCYSLQDIAMHPYFYEQWIYFALQSIPYQQGYKKWAQKKYENLLHGQDIKFVGFKNL